jgi:hypothetical protein
MVADYLFVGVNQFPAALNKYTGTGDLFMRAAVIYFNKPGNSAP